jgi:hypothetical protein
MIVFDVHIKCVSILKLKRQSPVTNRVTLVKRNITWIPACAGMTGEGVGRI